MVCRVVMSSSVSRGRVCRVSSCFWVYSKRGSFWGVCLKRVLLCA